MKKWYKSHQKPALIGTIMILLLIGYLAGSIYFNDKFLKGTVINDCSVETLSLKQANQKLEKQVSSKSLTLVFNDGQSEVMQANQLGISYNEKNSWKQRRIDIKAYGFISKSGLKNFLKMKIRGRRIR